MALLLAREASSLTSFTMPYYTTGAYQIPLFARLLESLFGRLRRHQRRVSGRKSTRELRDFGQYQVLLLAGSEEELLEQIRQVPLEEYRENRRWLEEAETPRRLLHRLACIAIRSVRCATWSSGTLHVELLSRRWPISLHQYGQDALPQAGRRKGQWGLGSNGLCNRSAGNALQLAEGWLTAR